MIIQVLSINHTDQIAPLLEETLIAEVMAKKAKVRSLVKEEIANRSVDLICEESDPCKLSIAQQEAFNHEPRVPWKNITMTAQERLEAGIWEALLNRPSEPDFDKGIAIEHRIQEDDVREEFFRDEILKAARKAGAKSVLVLCGDMHTEALKVKLEAAGHDVETNYDLMPEKLWKIPDSD